MKHSHAFIGGDLRQVLLMKHFMNEGKSCVSYGIPYAGEAGLPEVDSLEAALCCAKYVLCPVPVPQAGDLSPHAILPFLREGQIFYGGCLNNGAVRQLKEKNITFYDYMQDEELTLFNTIATAEGILAEAIMKYPKNLHGTACLIIGYGRCGRILADKLKGLGADASVCSRRGETLAEAYAMGLKGFLSAELCRHVQKYDLIFNTAPKILLDEMVLSNMKKGSYIFDIASAPGGVDEAAADRLSINTQRYPGLPGKYAPLASADALYGFILKTAPQN